MIAIAKALTPRGGAGRSELLLFHEMDDLRESGRNGDGAEDRRKIRQEAAAGLCMPLTGDKAGTEPIGDRLVEVPTNPDDHRAVA